MSNFYSGFDSGFINATIQSARANRQTVQKGFTLESVATEGLQGYNLDPLVKNIFPVNTPVRNLLPREKIVGGNSINWKVFTGINVTNVSGDVEDGKRAARIEHRLINKSVPFKTLGFEDLATFNSIFAGQNLDARSQVIYNLSDKLYKSAVIEEEKKVLYGNLTAIGKPSAVSVVPSETAGSLEAGALSVRAVPLTGWGLRSSSVSRGVNLTEARLNADGTTTVIVGGYGVKSDVVSATATENGSVDVLVTDVKGAAGYAIFVGAAGSERLAYVGPFNFVNIKSVPSTSQVITSLADTDQSADLLDFDGFLATAANEGGRVVSLDGASIEADGQVVPVLEDMISGIYDQFQISAKYMVMNNKTASALFKAIRGKDAAVAVTIVEGKPTVAGSYFSSYMSSMTGTLMGVLRDPHMEDGQILFFTDDISELPLSGVDNVARMIVQEEWNMIEWPLRTRAREFGVYCTEVFAHSHPGTIGFLKNIKV